MLGCMQMTIIGERWKQRNNIVFRNTIVDPMEIFVIAHVKPWSWFTRKMGTVSFSYFNWC